MALAAVLFDTVGLINRPSGQRATGEASFRPRATGAAVLRDRSAGAAALHDRATGEATTG